MRDFLLRENNIGVLLLLSIDNLPAECLLSCHAYCIPTSLILKFVNYFMCTIPTINDKLGNYIISTNEFEVNNNFKSLYCFCQETEMSFFKSSHKCAFS